MTNSYAKHVMYLIQPNNDTHHIRRAKLEEAARTGEPLEFRLRKYIKRVSDETFLNVMQRPMVIVVRVDSVVDCDFVIDPNAPMVQLSLTIIGVRDRDTVKADLPQDLLAEIDIDTRINVVFDHRNGAGFVRSGYGQRAAQYIRPSHGMQVNTRFWPRRLMAELKLPKELRDNQRLASALRVIDSTSQAKAVTTNG